MSGLRDHRGKILVAVVIVGLVGAVAALQLRGVEVSAVALDRTNLVQTVLVSGRVLPPAEIELSARTEAPVLEVLAHEGDRVEAGALLARLDATEAEAEVARARALLARAEATSGRSRSITPRVAQESLTTSQVQLEEARRALEQAESLVASGAWPSDRLSDARTSVTRAVSGERTARLELSAARGADRRVAAAAVDEALAALTLATQRLAETMIRAPVGGVVLERLIDAGDTARPGNVVFRLAAEGPPILSVHPDERHLSQLEVGQPAMAEADAYQGRAFPAALTFIAPAVDPERGTVEVRLLPEGVIDYLRPNMTVSVEIEVARVEDASVLPSELVFGAATDQPWVWVEQAGALARRDVTLGLRGDEQVEIVEGLAEGEAAIDVGELRLEAGDRVRVGG